jgi:hypothetical protein
MNNCKTAMTNKIQVRRASDDKVIEIDLSNLKDLEMLKEFSKETNGYLHKWYNQAKKQTKQP